MEISNCFAILEGISLLYLRWKYNIKEETAFELNDPRRVLTTAGIYSETSTIVTDDDEENDIYKYSYLNLILEINKGEVKKRSDKIYLDKSIRYVSNNVSFFGLINQSYMALGEVPVELIVLINESDGKVSISTCSSTCFYGVRHSFSKYVNAAPYRVLTDRGDVLVRSFE